MRRVQRATANRPLGVQAKACVVVLGKIMVCFSTVVFYLVIKECLAHSFFSTKATFLSTPYESCTFSAPLRGWFFLPAPSGRHIFMNCFSITQVQSITAGTGNKCQNCRRTEPFADKHAGLQCYTLDTVSCLDTRIESTIDNRASRL